MASDSEYPTTNGDIALGLVLVGPMRIRPVIYEVIDGFALVEGDMEIGPVSDLQMGPVPRGIGRTGQQYRWPNACLVYKLDSSLTQTQRTRVDGAIQHWRKKAPKVDFAKKTKASKNYVVFKKVSKGCSAFVGMCPKGSQTVKLSTRCSTGSVIHEIGHAFGLWHEHSREDRDQYVTINWNNILPTKVHNFYKHVSDGDDIGGYDYESIMHYSSSAFASDKTKPTITPKTKVSIGQRNELSDGDINAVYTLYGK